MTWFEALPPLVIMIGCMGIMGSLQGVVHRRFHDGKVGNIAKPVLPRSPTAITDPRPLCVALRSAPVLT